MFSAGDFVMLFGESGALQYVGLTYLRVDEACPRPAYNLRPMSNCGKLKLASHLHHCLTRKSRGRKEHAADDRITPQTKRARLTLAPLQLLLCVLPLVTAQACALCPFMRHFLLQLKKVPEGDGPTAALLRRVKHPIAMVGRFAMVGRLAMVGWFALVSRFVCLACARRGVAVYA
jgi:hypothetical protein